jgi:hypothetical protein
MTSAIQMSFQTKAALAAASVRNGRCLIDFQSISGTWVFLPFADNPARDSALHISLHNNHLWKTDVKGYLPTACTKNAERFLFEFTH